MSTCQTEIRSIIENTPRYTPDMNTKLVYRHITKNNGSYRIDKYLNSKTEYFGTFYNIVDAVHERDLLENVGWDLDVLIESPTNTPDFSINDLPPFPNKRRGSKYFGFKNAVLLKGNLNKDRLNKVWRSSIKYKGHSTSLGLSIEPLTPSILYAIVKKEVMKVTVYD